jgi:hypothetical protein
MIANTFPHAEMFGIPAANWTQHPTEPGTWLAVGGEYDGPYPPGSVGANFILAQRRHDNERRARYRRWKRMGILTMTEVVDRGRRASDFDFAYTRNMRFDFMHPAPGKARRKRAANGLG